MIKGLVNAETEYYAVIGNNRVDIERALKMNRIYCDKLFELYHTLVDPEEKTEMEYEIDYHINQGKLLQKIKTQLNQGGTA